MNSNIQNLLPKIVSILNEYGVAITILRDIYENECGVKTLKEQAQPIYEVKAVIDNSKASGKTNNNYKVNGVLKPQITATVYIAYDSKLTIEDGDYFILDGMRYTLSIPQDLLHYHLLYQLNAEVNIDG